MSHQLSRCGKERRVAGIHFYNFFTWQIIVHLFLYCRTNGPVTITGDVNPWYPAKVIWSSIDWRSKRSSCLGNQERLRPRHVFFGTISIKRFFKSILFYSSLTFVLCHNQTWKNQCILIRFTVLQQKLTIL